MGTVQFRSVALLAYGLFLVCLLLSLLAVSSARADVGPEPIMPGGSTIKPEGRTPIEMQAEKVTINVRKATKADNAVINFDPEWYGYDYYPVWFPAVAEVEAEFTMNNPTSEKVSMAVWFPLASTLEDERWESRGGEVVPSIKRFQVIVKGKPVDYSVSELPNPQGGDSPPLPWASFPVTFPAKENVKIKVSYVVPAERPESKSKGLIMDFHYIFQTGAGWAGPIGKAVLVVNLPYPASPETIVAMPGGGQVNGERVRWTWENFEPGSRNDFSISMMQPGPWEDLKAARGAVKDRPRDGQAWVKLCDTYYGLGHSGWYENPGFSEIYPPLGQEACQEAARLLRTSTLEDGQAWLKLCAIYYRLNMDRTSNLSVSEQACQEAAHLLPGDAAPHYGLAILYLSGLSENPSPEELQPVLDELKIGQDIEAIQPPSNEVYYFLPMFGLDAPPAEYITEWVNRISTVPTATAEPSTATKQAIATSTPQPSATTAPPQKPTLAPTSVPSATPHPLPSANAIEAATAIAPTSATPASVPQVTRTSSLIFIAAAGVILIVAVVYLVLKRRV